MKKNILIFLLLFVSINVIGQDLKQNAEIDTAKIYKITLTDGSTFVGPILEKNPDFVIIKTASIPRVDLPVNKIKAIEKVEPREVRNGIYWFKNPNATRYFFAPSAINLKKGEGYYQNFYLVFNSFNVGVSDNISIGGGFEFISTVVAKEPILFITPKVGFKIAENLHAGGGLLYARVGGYGNYGIAFGVATLGNLDHNITLGMGWGYTKEEFSSRPNITISGMTRVSKNIALVTENWFIPSSGYGEGDYFDGLYTYGIRFFGEKLAVDLGFFNNEDIARWIPIGIPLVGFMVKF
jgi:hypothetical protein